MPPLERRMERKSPAKTEEELQRDFEVHNMCRVLHDKMKSITVKPRKSRWNFPSTHPHKSITVTYDLSNEPEYIKMDAWIEDRFNKEVMLMTQVVSTLNGKHTPVEQPSERASTRGGSITSWDFEFHPGGGVDTRLESLSRIDETLDLIVQAERTEIQQSLGHVAVSQ